MYDTLLEVTKNVTILDIKINGNVLQNFDGQLKKIYLKVLIYIIKALKVLIRDTLFSIKVYFSKISKNLQKCT